MRTPESWEKDELDKYLKSINAYVVKPATFGYGQSGHADRVVCIKGTFWSLEVKREGKEPTKLQWLRIKEVRAAGGQAAWGTAPMIKFEINKWLGEQQFKQETLGR